MNTTRTELLASARTAAANRNATALVDITHALAAAGIRTSFCSMATLVGAVLGLAHKQAEMHASEIAEGWRRVDAALRVGGALEERVIALDARAA